MYKISITNVPRKSGVYQFKNNINNKVYIGSSKNIYYRLKDHLKTLRANKHYNNYFQSSWNKYGEENFEFSILELCDVKNILIVEQKYIDNNNACNSEFGYNLMPNALNNSGYKWTDDYKRKRSKYEIDKYANLTGDEKEKKRQQLIQAYKCRKNFTATRESRIKKSRKMKFISKEGLEYIPELPVEFMKKHLLDISECHKVAKSKQKPTYGRNGVKYFTTPKTHKGWKIEYV